MAGGGVVSDQEVEGLSPEELERYVTKARRVGFLSLCLKAGIAVLAVLAVVNGSYMGAFAGLVSLSFALLPTVLKRNYKITIPWVLELLIFLAVFLHVAGGVLGLYERFERWDTMTHFVSAFMLGVVSLTIIYIMHVYWEGITMDVRALMIFTVIIGGFLGVIWEILEWSADQVLGTHEQFGLGDTMKDLVMDLVGSMLAALLGAKWIMDGTLRRMTADFGDSLNVQIFEKMVPIVAQKRRDEGPDPP